MMHESVRNLKNRTEVHNHPQTICFTVVLVLFTFMEFRNLYHYISAFVSNRNDKVIVVLYNLNQSVSPKNIIRRELVVDKEYSLYHIIISVLSSILILYFLLSALWMCWKCGINSFVGAFNKFVMCCVIWVALALLVLAIDFFFEVDVWLKILMTCVFLFIMFTVIDDYFMNMCNENIGRKSENIC